MKPCTCITCRKRKTYMKKWHKAHPGYWQSERIKKYKHDWFQNQKKFLKKSIVSSVNEALK